MEWLAVVIILALVYGTIIWPLTKGRQFFGRDAAARASDVANQVYAARPDDGFTEVPFDPVPRGPLVRAASENDTQHRTPDD